MDLVANLQKHRCTHLDKVVHAAQLMSTNKSIKWLHKMIDTGKILTSGESYTHIEGSFQKFKDFVSIVVEGLNTRYGSDWDVHLRKVDDEYYSLDFFTLFKEVKIENSEDASHIIKNLIVHFPIKKNNDGSFYISRIKGGRATYTMKEIHAQYSHSHLRGSVYSLEHPLQLGEFCIGSGDLSLVEGILKLNFNLRDFVAFLYEIDATVRWESLEGNPYMYIRDITRTRKVRCIPQSITWDTFVNEASSEVLPFNYYISENKYKIHFDDTFKQVVKSILSQPELEYLLSDVLCVYNASSKNYYKYNSLITNDTTLPCTPKFGGESAYLIYNGSKVHFKIIPDPLIEVSSEDLSLSQETPIIHPNFLHNVHQQFESNLQEKILRFSAISKYYSATYQSRNPSQNTVSV